jgi:phage terminase large subunit-like protein
MPRKKTRGELAADRAVAFMTQLRQSSGKWAGVPLKLMPWQEHEVIRPLFGTLDRRGKRRYRTAYIEVPRKNGKTTLAAGVALYLLFADKEPGAQVYGAAADRDQASLVFNEAAAMVRSHPTLRERSRVIDSQKRIVVPSTGSFYRAIPADAAGSHGFNASGIVFDEIHAQPSRELYDVLSTSTSSREQPLLFGITTAGYDRTSICWELHEYAERLLRGEVRNPAFFPYIRGLAADEEWTNEALWPKANPSLGVTFPVAELRAAVQEAKDVPARANTIRRLRFNQWTSSESRWFDIGAWDACGGLLKESELAGQPCYAGLDLSSTSDFSAWVLYFPESHRVLCRFWVPRAAVERRTPMRETFEVWERRGWLTVTDGDTIDYQALLRDISKDAEKYQIREVGYDPWNSTSLVLQLEDHGLTTVKVGQSIQVLNRPSKELERLVLSRELNHGGNPVLRWMADTVQAETDANGNVKPSKKRSLERIDGIVALVIALERAVAAPRTVRSAYEDRDLEVI